MEEAHPEPVFVSDSYDKLNGLVENLQEQQQILYNIVFKPARGSLFYQKYASTSQDLMKELIRLGYYLDNTNHIQLSKIADQCAGQLHKEAIAPLAIAGIIAGALGLIADGRILLILVKELLQMEIKQ